MARCFYILLVSLFLIAGCKGHPGSEPHMEDAVCYPQVHSELMHHKLPDSFYSVDEWSGENMYVLSYMYMKICTDSVVWEEGHVRVDVMFPVDNGYSGNY